MCALTPSVLQQTLSFWTHFPAIGFIFEVTYAAAVPRCWDIWRGTLCSAVLWDLLFHWVLDTESGSILMHKVILAFMSTSFLSFSGLQIPWVWSDLQNHCEQSRCLTSNSYRCTASYWLVTKNECWRNICIVVQDKYDIQNILHWKKVPIKFHKLEKKRNSK